MEIRTWPIARSTRDGLCRLGLPQRLGDGRPYVKDSYQSFPSLEEVAGDGWCSAILSELLGDLGLVAWWTTTKVLKESGLSGRGAAKLPDHLNLAAPGGHLWVETFAWRGRALLLADLAERELADLVLEWAGGDTEFDVEFLCSAPRGDETWELETVRRWCKAKEDWGRPEALVPAGAGRVVALFDGDIHCALPEAAAAAVLRSLTDLAASWHIEVIAGPEEYSWLPDQG